MPSSIVSLAVANIVGAMLLLVQLWDAAWSRNLKFVLVCFAIVPVVIALYNISVHPHEDRRVMSFSLSALALAFMATIGTLMLH